MSSMSLNEIRIVQNLSTKRRIAFSQVSDKDKKVYRQLCHKGIVKQNNGYWELTTPEKK